MEALRYKIEGAKQGLQLSLQNFSVSSPHCKKSQLMHSPHSDRKRLLAQSREGGSDGIQSEGSDSEGRYSSGDEENRLFDDDHGSGETDYETRTSFSRPKASPSTNSFSTPDKLKAPLLSVSPLTPETPSRLSSDKKREFEYSFFKIPIAILGVLHVIFYFSQLPYCWTGNQVPQDLLTKMFESFMLLVTVAAISKIFAPMQSIHTMYDQSFVGDLFFLGARFAATSTLFCHLFVLMQGTNKNAWLYAGLGMFVAVLDLVAIVKSALQVSLKEGMHFYKEIAQALNGLSGVAIGLVMMFEHFEDHYYNQYTLFCGIPTLIFIVIRLTVIEYYPKWLFILCYVLAIVKMTYIQQVVVKRFVCN